MNWSDFQKKHVKPADFDKVSVDGDPNFDLERHNKLIEETIKHNERISRDKKREYDEGIKERAWAVTKYIENLKSGGGETNTEKYFGRNYINYLKGQEISEKYKMAWNNAKKKKQSEEAFVQKIKSEGGL